MKHLFYIHSFITYIISSSIVSELEIEPSVIFIYGREFTFQNESNIKIFSLPKALMSLAQFPSYGAKFLFLKKYHEINKLDRLVTKLVSKDEFIIYLPSTKNYLMQLLATHPKCCDLAFIEEGLMTYTAKFNKETYKFHKNFLNDKITKILKFPNHGNRSFFYRSYTHSQPLPVYVLHNAIDSLEDNIDSRPLKIIKFPTIEPRYKIDNGYLLIIDSNAEDGILSTETYLCVLNVFIADYLQNKSVTVWIRFRPKYTNQSNVIQLFEKNSINVEILPDDVCIESVFHFSKNVTVFGLHSSLLFYASIWGHKSYSLLEKLFEIDSDARQRYRIHMTIPQSFYDQVTMLQ